MSLWEERGFWMPPAEKTTFPPRLRLVDGDECASGSLLGSGLTLEVKPQAPLLRRPGDHLELFNFSEGVSLVSVRAAARRRGLCSETALALVIERALVIEELRGAGLEDLVGGLDRRADAARPTIELWSAHGSYIRHLLGLVRAASDEKPLGSPRVALPVRLIDRLNEDEPQLGQEAEAELRLAIDWEIAALVAGQTMGEWGYRAALAELID